MREKKNSIYRVFLSTLLVSGVLTCETIIAATVITSGGDLNSNLFTVLGDKDIDGDGIADVRTSYSSGHFVLNTAPPFGLTQFYSFHRGTSTIVVADGTGVSVEPPFYNNNWGAWNSDDNWSKVHFTSGDGWVQWQLGPQPSRGIPPEMTPIRFVREDPSEDLSAAGAAAVGSNTAPIAEAGENQSIRAGDMVNLNGNASYDDNTESAALVYSWSFFSTPAGSFAALSGANTATPSFVADVAGTYVVELEVTDVGGLVSDPPDQVEISSDNMAPTAAAGDDDLAIIGTDVVLDGSGSSDPEDPMTFAWTLTSVPTGSSATLSDPDMEIGRLTPDLEGVYVVMLTVSDFIGPGTPDTLEITVTTAAGFSEILIVDSNNIVGGLGASEVTTGGNQNAFGKHLANAIKDLQEGDTAGAIDKLNKAIARTDGCFLRGSPDGNGQGRDWITDCDAQEVVYNLLNAALDAIQN